MIKTLKILGKRWLGSFFKMSDLFSIINTWLTARHPVYFSNSIGKTLKGKVIAEGLAFVGVFSNKIALDPKAAGQFRVSKGGTVHFEKNVRIARGCTIFVDGKLFIGDYTYIQPNANIIARTEVRIGKNCAISWNFQALDDDLHVITIDGIEKERTNSILIENHVWIGSNVTVLKNTKIGENCVIATGSVVKGNFPPNCLIAGVPAKIIKQNVNWK